MTEYGSVWPIDQDTLIFYGIYSVLLGALSYGMKLTMKKKDDKEPVFQCIIGGSIIFTIMLTLLEMPLGPQKLPVEGKEQTPNTIFGTIFLTWF